MKIDKKLKNEKISQEIERKRKYATLLKRKRVENKYTLEDVSTGICTVSYLSRIENSLVDVDESYFISLFKKFNIDFNLLKEEKENEIFSELLKCYLQSDDETAINIISNALNTNYYADIEYELMLLYDNIMKEFYTEARIQILELNKKLDVLIELELTFFLFLSALYAFRTNQFIFACKQIIVLCEIDTLAPTYRIAIFDLALDIFHHMGYHELYYKYYNLIHTYSYLSFYQKSALKHQAQMIYIESIANNEGIELILTEIKNQFVGKNKEEIDWIILKNMFKNSSTYEILNYLVELEPTPRLIALESILVLRCEEDYYFKQLKQRRKSVSFKITDQIFELMYETCINIKINNDYLTAYNDVKKILTIQNKTSYFKFLLDIQVILFIEIALKCGKYKDCLKMVNLILKEKSIFSHFF